MGYTFNLLLIPGKRHIEEAKELPCFLIGICRGGKDDVHASDLVDLVVLDLREDQLLLDAKSVISSSIKGVGVNTAEVTDTGKCQIDKSVKELVHAVAAKGDFAADGHAFPDLEVRDGLLTTILSSFGTCMMFL